MTEQRRAPLHFFIFMVIYLAFAAGYVVWSIESQETEIMASIDKQLLSTAYGLPHMLAEDFHDRAVADDSITYYEELKNRKKFNEFSKNTGAAWVYTLVKKDGKFYFSAPSVSEEEAKEQKVWYFLPYPDIPPEFVKAFDTGIAQFVSYTDQWGSFRSVALPQLSPSGRRYLACADYDIGYVRGLLHRKAAEAGIVAAIFLCIAMPLILFYKRLYHSHSRLNLKLAEHRDNLEATVRERTADLTVAKEAAETAGRAKSDFLARMSHEIRNPLSSIINSMELLDSTDLDSRQRAYANICRASGTHLLDLLSDILDMSRIESDQMELEHDPLDLHQLAASTVRMTEPKLLGKPVTVSSVVGRDVPQWVLGDSLRLRQVLVNLLGNAAKFTATGEIELALDADAHGKVTFSVTDTGIGIPEERLGTIFERFAQAENTTARNYGGTGLGLAISHNLVTLMGGDLAVASEPGKGSVFTFTIPMELTDPPIQTADGAPITEIEPKHILVADDSPINRMLMEHMIAETPHTTHCVANGHEALEYYKKEPVDVIVMDMQMPVLDGVEAVAEIRKLESMDKRGRVPVIMLSANAFAKDKRLALAAGCDAYLAKPVSKAILLQTIANLGGQAEPAPGRE